MAGRHTQVTAGSQPHRLRLVVAATVVLALVAGGVTAFLLLRPSDRSAGVSVSSAGNSSGSRRAPACAAGIALTVVAAEAIAAAVSDIAATWVASRPVIDGACPTVTVRTSSSASAEATLIGPNTTLPDIWIPDSSLWLQRLRSDIAGEDSAAPSMVTYPAVASSPLVLATAAANQAAVATVAQGGWAAALAAPNISLIDPTASTNGLLTLLTAQSLLAAAGTQPTSGSTASAPSRQYVNTMVTLAHSKLTDTNAAFLTLSTATVTPVTFPASEQEVIAYNHSRGSEPAAVSVMPSGKALSFDFPVAQFAPPGSDSAERDAATALIGRLSTTASQQLLRAAGLREADGQPLPSSVGAGATTTTTDNLAPPTADQMTDGLRVWNAAARKNRSLLVIDVSSSMAASIGGDESTIQFAADAEKAAIDFFPDSSALGLWTFSAKSNPKDDWTQVVPLGTLGSKVGSVTRRQALVSAAATLPGRTGGNTGLYNTVLGAYQALRTGYDAAAANSVVLLTDGSNTQTAGVGLDALLSMLRSDTTSAAPLPIITIAVGKDADIKTLQQISAATGGTTLTAAQSSNIRDAMLDALLNAG